VAELCLGAGEPETALRWAAPDKAAGQLLSARALAELGRREEGLRAYRAAVAENPALEDLALANRLSVSVVEFPAQDGRPRLKVISNDDTDQNEILRVLEPPRE